MKAPRLVSVATAVPPHVVRQEEARAFAAGLFRDMIRDDPRLVEIFDHARIETRHACATIEWLLSGPTFAQRNARYVEWAVRLAVDASRRALERAGVEPRDVDHVVFVSSTGIATPSIDARLANELGLRGDARRTPVWGLGCAGGAAGVSLARDLALADPAARVLLVALELCTLAFLPGDRSKRNLVATSLFGDGAAAAVIAGPAVRPGPDGAQRALDLLATRSILWPGTLDVMGWELVEDGLQVVFSRDIPSIVMEKARPGLVEFLASRGLGLSDVAHVVAHPGGAKVLSAYAEALSLPPAALAHAREVLRTHGNMSSPSCLFVLERFLGAGDIGPGEHALLMALGPGFAAEYVLARGAGD